MQEKMKTCGRKLYCRPGIRSSCLQESAHENILKVERLPRNQKFISRLLLKKKKLKQIAGFKYSILSSAAELASDRSKLPTLERAALQ